MVNSRATSPLDFDDMLVNLKNTSDDTNLFSLIVNEPFEHRLQTNFLFLGIIVLLLVDKKTGTIERIALSDTDFARLTTDVSVVPFEEIKINLNDTENIISKAIKTGQMQDTTDWKFLFTPALTAVQARINQANAGIAYSAVYPLTSRGGGALIYSYFQYKDQLGEIQVQFMTSYTNIVNKALAKH